MVFFGKEYQVFDKKTENPALSQIGYMFAGLLVGVGTALGTGCTSGHGMCGLP